MKNYNHSSLTSGDIRRTERTNFVFIFFCLMIISETVRTIELSDFVWELKYIVDNFQCDTCTVIILENMIEECCKLFCHLASVISAK